MLTFPTESRPARPVYGYRLFCPLAAALMGLAIADKGDKDQMRSTLIRISPICSLHFCKHD